MKDSAGPLRVTNEKGPPAMTDAKYDPITIQRPPHVVAVLAVLAEWARADAKAMHPDTDRQVAKEAREEREGLANAFTRGAVHALPAFSAEGDLADALNERDAAYEAFRVDNAE